MMEFTARRRQVYGRLGSSFLDFVDRVLFGNINILFIFLRKFHEYEDTAGLRLHSVPPDFRAMSMGFRFTLRQLRYFLAAAEAPTITAAAKKANVSQGAMAEALDELERQLGSPLFVRRKARGVFITAYGEALVEHARTVLTAAEELQSFAAGRGGFGGHATIGSYTTLAPFLLPRLADALAREHPDLHLDIVTGSGEAISRSLREGRCDIAILYSHHLAAGMDVDTLYSIGARIVLPAAHPLARRKTIFLGDLAQERLIEFDVEPALSNTRKIFHDFGVRPRLGMKADSIELIRALVARGLGYSVLLHHPPGDLSYEGIALAVRPIRGLTSFTGVVLAQAEAVRESPRHRLLRQFCLKALRHPPAVCSTK
jgi:DNA-binding transcriptional LysR family regulator